ncbi:MAG: ATP-dependent DNA helicase [Euryarchaeota archaeon]|nr:ATP-dependent DNA helicase [Euryarchaeota archaeon]
MDLFPYPYRGEQEEMVRQVRDAVLDGRPLVMESGTGTGKTVSALSGALEAVLGTGRRVVYLTRTKSQQRQVLREAGAIAGRAGFLCVGMQGRNITTCPLMRDDPDLAAGTAEELSRLCSAHKRRDADGRSGCPFFEGVDEVGAAKYAEALRRDHPSPERFFESCIADGVCPYEMTKLLLRDADVIAAPYPFVFLPAVKRHFHEWIGASDRDLVLIVDEAHNLPEHLRGMMSCEYTAGASRLAETEAAQQGDPEVHRGIRVSEVARAFRECLESALAEHLDGDDGLLPHGYLQEWMMSRFGMPSTSLDGLYEAMIRMGEGICDAKQAEFKLPRSHIRSFGRFMRDWNLCDQEHYVHLVVGADRPRFEAYCLDPYEVAEPLRLCRASVSMSGTLCPLGHYIAELGLEGATEKVFPSPFPEENLMVINVEDVSTSFEELRQDPDTYRRIEEHVAGLIRSVDRNTAVFFPSYGLMDRFIEDGIPGVPGREVYRERRGMSQSELMDLIARFSSSEAGVLFCVFGGRISEGMDFPGREMELAILIGIPFPKPTAKQKAVTRYHEYRFGDGWEYASRVPAQRKMRQSIGRLIRSEDDRGVAVILDRRVQTMAELKSTSSADPVADVKAFFEGRNVKLYK